MKRINNHSLLTQSALILSLIILATLTRLPTIFGVHTPNISPLNSIALFCGAHFSSKRIALIPALLSAWFSDIMISHLLFGHWVLFYQGCFWQYSCYFLITLFGITVKQKTNLMSIFCAALSSSLLFYLISNFGVWYSGIIYATSMNGLLTCYIAAIPFFKNTLISDILFCLTLFYSYRLLRAVTAWVCPLIFYVRSQKTFPFRLLLKWTPVHFPSHKKLMGKPMQLPL